MFIISKKINITIKNLFHYDLMSYIFQGQNTNHLHMHFIPRYKNEIIFDNITFVDEQWGKSYSPYNKDFDISNETKLKIFNEIKKNI